MSPLAPDLFTAAGMSAVAALLLASVLRVQGKLYAHHGVLFAMVGSLLFACACIAFAWHSRASEIDAMYLPAKLLLSGALAGLTLAVHRFCGAPQRSRDAAIAAVPITALLLIAIGHHLFPTTWLHTAHASVWLLQCLYVVWCLVRIRPSTPGYGWQMLAASMALLAVSLAAGMYATRPTAAPEPIATSALLLWLVGTLPMLVHAVANLGFLHMLHDRDYAAEQGLSQLDALTQLPNRAALVQHLKNTIEQAATHSEPMAVMVLDIDHFKSVNDSYGHLVGDHVIQRIARTLVEQARTGDFSARYGGEEFVVVLPNTTARDAFHLAERLCQAVRKAPMPLPNGKLLHITVSVGVYAGHPTHGNSWERLVAAADEAMYVAKRSGRDRVAMSAPIEAVQPASRVPA